MTKASAERSNPGLLLVQEGEPRFKGRIRLPLLVGRFLISRTPRIPPHGTFRIAAPAAASRHP